MFRITVTACLLTLALSAAAQDDGGELTGTSEGGEAVALSGTTEPAMTVDSQAASTGYTNALGRLPSLRGQSGLFHLATADGMPAQTFGLGVHGEFFTSTDVVRADDDNQRFVGRFTLAYAATDFLEVFAGLSARGNANTLAEPSLIQTMGDILLGAKAFTEISDGFSLGGSLGLIFLNAEDSVGLALSATSVDMRLLAGYALQNIPLAFHAN